jgi:hypothetical protein
MSGKRSLKKADITSFLDEIIQEEDVYYRKETEPQLREKAPETNLIQPPSTECHSTSFNSIQIDIQPPSTECHSTSFNSIQPPFECHSKQPSLTELKVLSFLNKLDEEKQEIKTTKQEISSATGITIKGAETAIRRLIQKGYLKKESYSSGRYTGFTKYNLTEASSKVLISISFNIIQPPSQPPSYKERKNNIILNYFFSIPENLKNIGLKETMIKTEREDLQEVLNHLSFSLEKKEFKTTNPLATAISIINGGKNWVSGKFIEEENKILDEQDRRLKELKSIKEQQLLKAYEIFKLENPSFLESIKSKQPFVQNSPHLLEKLGFEEFKQQNNITERQQNEF